MDNPHDLPALWFTAFFGICAIVAVAYAIYTLRGKA